MKGNVMPSIVRMEEAGLGTRVTDVKETVARDIALSGIRKGVRSRPVFGIVDLWKIERKRKSASHLTKRRKLL